MDKYIDCKQTCLYRSKGLVNGEMVSLHPSLAESSPLGGAQAPGRCTKGETTLVQVMGGGQLEGVAQKQEMEEVR